MEKANRITKSWNQSSPHIDKVMKLPFRSFSRKAATGSLGIVGVLVIWTVFAWLHLVPAALLPGPLEVGAAAGSMLRNGSLLTHTIASLQRVLLGFLLAFGLALPLGFAMGTWKFLRNALNPLLELIRPIPPIAMIPLAILWFGIGEMSKIFIIVYGAFFPILLNVIGGVSQTEALHIKAAQSLGASRFHIFYYVTLRAAIPNIVIGMRSGVSMAFICLVGSELIAANAGLGFLIQEGRSLYKTDQVVVGMIAIGLVGLAINRLLIAFESQLIRWK
ncbi:ABC transporter permease [Paenibacillus sp. SI8]|uniref:ABC transporter permease n=1 Tax=unclassified Paenibacillus TaxID=185978 RepID=UPI003466AD1B